MTKSSFIIHCMILCLTCLLPFALTAAEPGKVPRTPLDQIHFDAATKRAFDRSGQYVTRKVKADGTVQTELNGSFQNVTVARVGPGGVIETYCTTNEQDARNWMARVDGRTDNLPANTSVQVKTP